jgi:Flp pilus assembly protein TadD
MRPILRAILTLFTLLRCAVPAQGGLYTTDVPVPGPGPDTAGVVKPLPARLFFIELGTVLQRLLPDKPAAIEYQQRLERLQDQASLSVADRVNLGEALIRLGRPADAIGVLRPVAGADFRATANLATAYYQIGETAAAQEYVQDALRAWPAEAEGLTAAQLQWYRQAEELLGRLLALRGREGPMQPRGGFGRATPEVDTLWPVRFVGPSGDYEAGRLAEAERARLPADALALVQQLVLWLPTDDRLYWLLAELYNAEGDLESAEKIFNDLKDARRFESRTLDAHRQAVRAARQKLIEAGPVIQVMLAAVAGAGDNSPPRPPLVALTPQTLLVGGLAGLAIVGFLVLQVRELVRRRRLRGRTAPDCCH